MASAAPLAVATPAKAAPPATASKAAAAHDPLEREAERLARAVTSGGTRARPSGEGPLAPPPPRRPAATADVEAPTAVRELLAAPGQPLAEPWLGDMQERFGHRFGDVRIHTGRQADEASRQISANAFTVGHHIAFSSGRFAPQTAAGRHLLAHELAHVVQQRTGNCCLQRDASDDDPDIAAILRAAGRAAKPGTPTSGSLAGIEVAYRLISKFLENYESLISGIGMDSTVKGIKATKGKGNDFSLAVGPDFVAGLTAGNLMAKAAQIRTVLDQQGAKPRLDYIFIMGEDRPNQPNQFYLAAETYYKTTLPQAKMIKDRRNLEAVLDYVANTVKEPVGSLYIVSHANEDGTLSFPINSADQDNKTSAAELDAMLHPGKGGSKLTKAGKNIDVYSKIRIKGCDIGRTQRMVELVDEAFGGEGTVTAPTHEQRFDYDADKAKAASKAFRDDIAKSHPQPELDKDLAKKNPAKAKSDLAKAKAQRTKDINAEIKAKADDEKRAMDEAAVFKEFSGPMFQRPGTKLYTKAELASEVSALYPHLDAKQQAALVKDLVAADQRPLATQQSQGTYAQQGQRLDRKSMDNVTYVDPQNIGEIKVIWAKDFAKEGFNATKLASQTSDGKDISATIEGTQRVPGEKQPQSTSFTIGWPVPPDEKELIATSKAKLGNADRYAWRIETVHTKNGKTKKTAIGERVITYLHHRSLRASPKQPFDRPESDPHFTATSTFAPGDEQGGKP